MKNQIRLPRKIALRFGLIFLGLSSASDWMVCAGECELIGGGRTFGLLAVNKFRQYVSQDIYEGYWGELFACWIDVGDDGFE